MVSDGFLRHAVDPVGRGADCHWCCCPFSLAARQVLPRSPDGCTAEYQRVSCAAADICDGYGAGGWSFAAEASDNDGLVLAGARLGPRQLVQEISVPYIEVTANWQGTGQYEMRRFELTRNPNSGHADVGIALMTGGVTCQGSGTKSISASAEYAVQGLPAGVTILVWQSYRFDSGTTGCEPSEKLPCNRFWPTVEWGANKAAAGFLQVGPYRAAAAIRP